MNPSYLPPQCLLESRETLRLGINLLKFLVMIAIDSNCFPSIFFKFKPIFHEKWPISAVFCWVFGVYQPNDGSRGRMIISSQTKGTNHLLPLKEQMGGQGTFPNGLDPNEIPRLVPNPKIICRAGCNNIVSRKAEMPARST